MAAPFTVYMSPALRQREERAQERRVFEKQVFRQQCEVSVEREEPTRCAMRLNVPKDTLIHNLSIQIREKSSTQLGSTAGKIVQKWRYVSGRSFCSPSSDDPFTRCRRRLSKIRVESNRRVRAESLSLRIQTRAHSWWCVQIK